MEVGELKVDDVLLCTVRKIEGATVFVDIDEIKGIRGSIMLSEIAAGRIRNLREYVSAGRKIVCKVLKIMPDHVELSLRRVTAKEREGLMEKYRQEATLRNVLKTVSNNPDEILDRIKKEKDILDFVEEAKENRKIFERYFKKEEAEKLAKIFAEKEKKEKEVTKHFVLHSFGEKGLLDIKEIVNVDAEIHYLGNGNFSIKVVGRDFKDAGTKMDFVMKEIEKRAKARGAIFEIKKEK
jgi:translation initiation factor 2 alpha subunit (eIF-2alpha)